MQDLEDVLQEGSTISSFLALSSSLTQHMYFNLSSSFSEIGLASVLRHSVVHNGHFLFLFQIKSYPLFTVEITKKSVSRKIVTVVLYNVLHGVN